MANTFKTTDFVAKTTTEFLEQKSPILNTANRNYVSEFNRNGGYAPGTTINVKVPKAQVVTDGLIDTVKGITDKIVPVTTTANDIHSITEELSVIEELLEIVGGGDALKNPNKAALVDNYGVTSYMALEARLEKKCNDEFSGVAYMTPVDTPSKLRPVNKFSDISNVRAMMSDLKLPAIRYGMMNIQDSQSVADSLQNMFNESINKGITESARIGGPEKGRLAGFDMFESADLQPHELVGEQFAVNKDIQVDSVGAGGTTITFKGLQASLTDALRKGDLISIPSVNLVENYGKVVKRWKLVIKVTENVDSTGGGLATVTLSDPLVQGGQLVNVSHLPAVNAPAELYPPHNVNYFYTPSGLSAVPLPLKDIRGAENSDIMYKKSSVPVKCVIQGAVLNFQNAFRTAVFCPVKAFADYVIVLPSAL